MPYGTGALVVREVAQLARAHAAEADYMPGFQSGDGRYDFCNLGPELSRDFRGLRVWLPMMMAGASAFREALDEKLDLCQWATEQLRDLDHIEIVAEPQLSIVAFRLAPPGARDLDALNRRLLGAINARRRVYLTATRLNDRFVLRICVLCLRTHADRMAAAIEDIRAAAEECRSGLAPSEPA